MKKMVITLCSMLVLSTPLQANETQPTEEMVAAAKKVVTLYQNLRSQCISMKGASSKTCFKQLKAANPSYRDAKKVLLAANKNQSEQLANL